MSYITVEPPESLLHGPDLTVNYSPLTNPHSRKLKFPSMEDNSQSEKLDVNLYKRLCEIIGSSFFRGDFLENSVLMGECNLLEAELSRITHYSFPPPNFPTQQPGYELVLKTSKGEISHFQQNSTNIRHVCRELEVNSTADLESRISDLESTFLVLEIPSGKYFHKDFISDKRPIERVKAKAQSNRNDSEDSIFFSWIPFSTDFREIIEEIEKNSEDFSSSSYLY